MIKKEFGYENDPKPKKRYRMWKSKKKWISGAILFMGGMSSVVSVVPAFAEGQTTGIESSTPGVVENNQLNEPNVVNEVTQAKPAAYEGSNFRGVIDAQGRSGSINYAGETGTVTEEYTLGGKRTGSDADYNAEERVLKVNVANLKKDDIVTVSVPNFKFISSAPDVGGTTKTIQGNTVTYKIANDGFNAAFDLKIKQAIDINQANLEGNIEIKIGDIVAEAIKLEANFKFFDVITGAFHPYNDQYHAAVGQTQKTVTSGEKFVSRIDPGNGINYNYSYAKNLTSYSYSIPVPKNYKLDVALTESLQKTSNMNGAVYDYRQEDIGLDSSRVILTFNKDKFNALNKSNLTMSDINRSLLFVGTIDGADGTYTATNKLSVTASASGIPEKTVEGYDPFSVTIASHPDGLEAGVTSVNDSFIKQEVYVSDSDVGNTDIFKDKYVTVGSSGKTTDNYEIEFKIPESVSSKAITLMENGYLIANGLKGQVIAYGADHRQLDSIDIQTLLQGRSGEVIWTPSTTDIISGYKVVLQGMPNTSFGNLAIQPKVTVNEKPNPKTTVNLPVTLKNNDKTSNLVNYNTTLTSDTTIYEKPGHIDGLGSTTISNPGETVRYQIRPFHWGDWPKSTNIILDHPMVIYAKVPEHMTFVNTDKFNENASVIKDSLGNDYVKIVIPAGTGVGSSKNPNYNSPSNLNRIIASFKVNNDIVDGQVLHLNENDGALRLWIGVKDQLDEDYWGPRVEEISNLTGDPAENLGKDAQRYGITKLYSGALNEKNEYTVSLPKVGYFPSGIKADGDPDFVFGNDVATFYPDEGKLSGQIRTYAYNGTASTISEYLQLLTLPKKDSGSSYSINLNGPITPRDGATILYSEEAIKKEDLDDRSSFVPESAVTDWTKIRSILITASDVAPGKTLEQFIDIKIADIDSDDYHSVAEVYSYSYGRDGETLIGNTITPLKTAIKKRAKVKVKYVDEANNELMPSDFVSGNVDEKVTLTAPSIAGYELNTDKNTSPKEYQMSDDPDQEVVFEYKKKAMTVIIKKIDKRTGKQIGGDETATGVVGSEINLEDDKYTKVDGYDKDPANLTKYTVTQNEKQVVELYFNPHQFSITVYYKYQNTSGRDLSPSETLTGYYPGDKLNLTAKEIENYIPENFQATVTIGTGDHQTYYFIYDDKEKKANNKIPAAGSKASMTLLGLGTGLVAASGLFFHKKKKDDDDDIDELKKFTKK